MKHGNLCVISTISSTSFPADRHAQTKTGRLFIALKGPNFNGNLFARQALEAGAALALVDEPVDFEDDRIIETDDALETLQELARHHRRQFSIPFIAVTGSNGKTTTKELVSEVLSTHYKTYTTRGNLNNHIGVPLTLLSIKADAGMAVIEMGANHQKEIEGYCRYAMPTHGLITNAGKAHLEGFGGVEGVRKGKGELFDYLRNHGGTAFIMQDYDYLQDMSKGIPTVKTYGTTDAEITGVANEAAAFLTVKMLSGTDLQTIKTNLVGDYNLPNVLAAVAIGKFFDVPETSIQLALENYTPSNSRSQLIQKGSNRIILDAYNANPTSMKAAIENFARMEGHGKILLLGAMKELGEESLAEHAAIVELIDQYHWKEVVLVGGDFEKLPHGFMYFPDVQSAYDWFQQQQFEEVQVLIKGSRSIQMEKILD